MTDPWPATPWTVLFGNALFARRTTGEASRIARLTAGAPVEIHRCTRRPHVLATEIARTLGADINR